MKRRSFLSLIGLAPVAAVASPSKSMDEELVCGFTGAKVRHAGMTRFDLGEGVSVYDPRLRAVEDQLQELKFTFHHRVVEAVNDAKKRRAAD